MVMVRTHPRRPLPSSSREWQTITPSFSPSCCMVILLSLSCCYLLQYSASSCCESYWPLWPTVAHAFIVAPIRSRNEAPPIVSFTTYTNNIHIANNIKGSSRLYSLKPAAIPLMDCGKALARSGELLIDLTTSLDIYGGSLSAMGANVRNCGDCLAQAAASCRFKTGVELVTDELREGADCLKEGSIKLQSAVQESEVDGNTNLTLKINNMISPMKLAAYHLEEAGASLMKREKVDELGKQLMCCGEALEMLSAKVLELSVLEEDPSSIVSGGDTTAPGKLSSQRMLYASQQMVLAGKELTTAGDDKVSRAKGKSWIKQGR